MNMSKRWGQYDLLSLIRMIILLFSLFAANTLAETARLMPVVPGYALTFPHDYGADVLVGGGEVEPGGGVFVAG